MNAVSRKQPAIDLLDLAGTNYLYGLAALDSVAAISSLNASGANASTSLPSLC